MIEHELILTSTSVFGLDSASCPPYRLSRISTDGQWQIGGFTVETASVRRTLDCETPSGMQQGVPFKRSLCTESCGRDFRVAEQSSLRLTGWAVAEARRQSVIFPKPVPFVWSRFNVG